MLNLLKEIADRSGGLTRKDAERLCTTMPVDWYTTPCAYSATSRPQFAASLRELFPAFNWRIIIDRSGEWTRWALTVDDDDPREHYFNGGLGGRCIHCGKSPREIARIDEANGDEEFLSEVAAKVREKQDALP